MCPPPWGWGILPLCLQGNHPAREHLAGGTSPEGTPGQPHMAPRGPGWFSPPGMSMQTWPQPMLVHRCPRGHCESAWHSSTHRPSALSPLSAGAQQPTRRHLAALGGLGLAPPKQAVPITSGHGHALPAAAGVTALLLSSADTVIQALAPSPAPRVPARLCPGALPGVLYQRRGPG